MVFDGMVTKNKKAFNNKMGSFDFNFDRSSNEAVLSRLDFYVSTDEGNTWKYLGIFDDEGSFETSKEIFEYDNDGQPFVSHYTKQKFQIKGSLLNTGNIYARAFAFGRDPNEVDASDPETFSLDLSELRSTPPYFALRACGQRQDGRYFVHELARAQVTTTEITETLNNQDIVKLPVEITGFRDPEKKMGFELYRYQVQKSDADKAKGGAPAGGNGGD
jgi:hypothetical protein